MNATLYLTNVISPTCKADTNGFLSIFCIFIKNMIPELFKKSITKKKKLFIVISHFFLYQTTDSFLES